MNIKRRSLLTGGSAATIGWLAGGIPVPAWAQAGKSLNIALFPEPNSVTAGAGFTGPALMVLGNIYDGLLRYDEKLKPMPSLATEWSVSNDQLVYTFKLKRNVKWHDGKPFTADDVVYSIDVLMRAMAPRMRLALQSVQSITALDSHTVEFRMKEVYPAFLGLFDSSTSIVAKHIMGGVDLTKPITVAPVGTGPFKFKEWQRGTFIHLVKNEDYHETGLPKLDNVYWHIIPDGASRAAAFESGKVDVLPGGTVEYFDVARLAKLPGVTVTTKGWEKFAPQAWMWINHRSPLLANVKVRQAIMHAVDREAMAKVIWHGHATPATGTFNRHTPYYTDKVASYPLDVAKAKRLLAEAGYKGETIRLLPIPFGEAWTRMAEMVKQNLTQAGFKVETISADLPGTIARQGGWDFDLTFTYLYQSGDPALGVSRNYISSEIKKGSTVNNVGGYSNAKVDALFERGAKERDPTKRAETYAEVQRILADDVATAWLLELNFPTVYRTKVNNLISSAVGLNDSLGRASIS
jgi:peptide/nickel transport system substrate-binding protein